MRSEMKLITTHSAALVISVVASGISAAEPAGVRLLLGFETGEITQMIELLAKEKK